MSDIFRHGSVGDHLEVLKCSLQVPRISPMVPDALGCCPFYITHPVCLKCPHVHFCDSTPDVGSKIIWGPEDRTLLLVAVPDFSATQVARLVNPRSLACWPTSFAGCGVEEDEVKGLRLGL